MINLNDYRQNIYHNEGIYECPHYSEDGVILKIFEIIGVNKNPLIIEFGETRSLGTTTRAFRIKYKSPSIYFTGNLNLRSRLLNLIDILKVTYNYFDPQYLKFIFNMPFKFFVTPDNIIDLFIRKKVKDIDILTIDIDSYDYFIAKKVLENKYKPRLLILEYNHNLGINNCISVPYNTNKLKPSNRRIYGASFNAINNLATKYGYKLVHISGFCNLFYIIEEYTNFFETPDIDYEITKSDKDVMIFSQKYCQKGFVPSWINERQLENLDLQYFEEV